MSYLSTHFVCAKHGLPFEYMTIAGAKIPYCKMCTEHGLYRKRGYRKCDPEILRNMNNDRNRVCGERAIWKGKDVLCIAGRKKIHLKWRKRSI